MNSDEQSAKGVKREQADNVSARNDPLQIAAFTVVLIVAAVGILAGFTHLMIPQWLSAMNENGRAMPEAIQLLMWVHHVVLTHWKLALLALMICGAATSILLNGATGKSNV